jgi:hypothetical protein
MVRYDEAWHDVEKLRAKGPLPEQVVPRKRRPAPLDFPAPH